MAQLRRSTDLDKTRPATYWYRAEALRLITFEASLSPEEKKETIEESVSIWDKSTDFGYPDRDTSWAYQVRGKISEQRADLQATSVGQQEKWMWESAAFTERGLLLYDEEASSWACLGRYHRFLKNEANALLATEKAWKLAPENPLVQEERAAILADVEKLGRPKRRSTNAEGACRTPGRTA